MPSVREVVEFIQQDENGLTLSEGADYDTAVHEFDAQLREHFHDFWHRIQNRGFSAGQDSNQGQISSLEDQVSNLNEQLETTRGQLETARQDNPDLDEIHDDYREQISDLETARDEALATIDDLHVGRAESDLSALLNQRLDPTYARVAARDARSRITRTDEGADQPVQVLRRPGGSARIQTGEDQTEIQALADEIITNAPDRMRLDDVDDGGGAAGNGGAPVSQNDLDAAAEAGKKQAQAENRQQGNGGNYYQQGTPANSDQPQYPG